MPSTNTLRNSTLILNRAGDSAEDNWYQIEKSGEHPAGKYGVQVIDAKARASMLAQFNREAAQPNFAGLLIDQDHFSHDPEQSTESFGWLMEMREKDGELEGRIDWTDIGAPAIQNKRFKFFSSEYDPEDLEVIEKGKVRPLRLAGLALTNRPNNKGGRPIRNKECECQATKQPSNQATNTFMTTIAEKLGLDPEASEEDILAQITELQKKVSEMEGEKADAEAEEILNRHEKKFPAAQRENWKNQLLTNRESTEQLLEGLEEPKAPATPKKADTVPLKNRSTSPAPVGDGDAGKADKEAKQIRNRANQLRSESPSRSYRDCWDQAEQEISNK